MVVCCTHAIINKFTIYSKFLNIRKWTNVPIIHRTNHSRYSKVLLSKPAKTENWLVCFYLCDDCPYVTSHKLKFLEPFLTKFLITKLLIYIVCHKKFQLKNFTSFMNSFTKPRLYFKWKWILLSCNYSTIFKESFHKKLLNLSRTKKKLKIYYT